MEKNDSTTPTPADRGSLRKKDFQINPPTRSTLLRKAVPKIIDLFMKHLNFESTPRPSLPPLLIICWRFFTATSNTLKSAFRQVVKDPHVFFLLFPWLPRTATRYQNNPPRYQHRGPKRKQTQTQWNTRELPKASGKVWEPFKLPYMFGSNGKLDWKGTWSNLLGDQIGESKSWLVFNKLRNWDDSCDEGIIASYWVFMKCSTCFFATFRVRTNMEKQLNCILALTSCR